MLTQAVSGNTVDQHLSLTYIFDFKGHLVGYNIAFTSTYHN